VCSSLLNYFANNGLASVTSQMLLPYGLIPSPIGEFGRFQREGPEDDGFHSELSTDDEDITAHENGDLAGEVCFAGVIFG